VIIGEPFIVVDGLYVITLLSEMFRVVCVCFYVVV